MLDALYPDCQKAFCIKFRCFQLLGKAVLYYSSSQSQNVFAGPLPYMEDKLGIIAQVTNLYVKRQFSVNDFCNAHEFAILTTTLASNSIMIIQCCVYTSLNLLKILFFI
ncbi:WD repeat-containing protein 62 [Platysternon megacephalum]|uniref:WD repeat-containing protein 62 n=1 Tax=Platysternon megacephalum TaxID=55544 RepID=A0A4D9DQZ6_9SAUR|nr:WD repeat-containing protein 62 [Platysternon megacephalum]